VVIVLIQNPETGQLQMHLENGPPEQALGALQTAVQMVGEQLAGPKVFLPNGQTKIIPPKPTVAPA
jgi:hypothetical protein